MSALLWIEEPETGRLIAATVPEKDGRYRFGGVHEGEFLLFASADGPLDDFGSHSSTIVVNLEEITKKDFVLRTSKPGVRVQSLGTQMRIGEIPIDLAAISGELYLGLRGSPHDISRVSVSGGRLSFAKISDPKTNPFFSSVKVVAFGVTSSSELPEGEYTLVIEGINGVKQYLVGSLVNR